MTATETPPRTTITSREIAELLGVSERHVRRMYEARQFPAPIKLGSRLRVWLRETVETWLRERDREAREQVEGARCA